MGSVFKQKWTKNGKRKQSKKYYGEYTDASGQRHRVPLCANKAAAIVMLAELESSGERPAWHQHVRTSLAVHLDAWEQYLRSREGGSKNVTDRVKRVRRVLLAECGWTRLAAIDAEVVVDVVQRLQTLATKYTPKVRPLSSQSRAYHLRDCRSFGKWLANSGRCQRNPLAMAEGSRGVEPVRIRRALGAVELAKFLEAVRQSQKTWRKLTGVDRYHLYLVAVNTGYRAQECAALAPEFFQGGAVTLLGKHTKNKKDARQPVHAEVMQELQAYLRSKPPGVPVWPSSWWRNASRMVRMDLAAAGIPYETDAGVVDFHALRHAYITSLVASGAHVKTVQVLARHLTPDLAIRLYAHSTSDEATQAADSAYRKLTGIKDETGDPRRVEGLADCDGEVEEVAEIAGKIHAEESAPSRTRTENPLIKRERTTPCETNGSNDLQLGMAELTQILTEAGLPEPLVQAIASMVRAAA